jgi:hypothetical protein
VYAPGNQPVFDFANQPGVLYYLLGRRPGTRFYHVSMAIPASAQHALIDDLRKSRPPVVVFTDGSFGLPTWDGVINPIRHYEVSQYLLDNYVPFVDVHGQLLMIRDDLALHRPALPVLAKAPRTTDLYFAGPTCNWGDVPNFLDPPSQAARHAAVTVSLASRSTNEVIRGWAVDGRTGVPARVVVVAGGRVVASVVPHFNRPDVAAARKLPSALRTGFDLLLPGGQVRTPAVYAIATDGLASLLPQADGTAPSAGVTSFRTPDGRTHEVVQGAADGFVDRVALSPYRYAIEFPAHVDLAAYEWLVIDAARPFGTNTFTIADRVLPDPAHLIIFNTLPRAGPEVSVRVGSCLAWHGYSASDLTITTTQAISPTQVLLLP